MKPVKQQWIDPIYEKYTSIHTNQSAFRPYKQEEEQYDRVDMSFDIETYINKRKFQNSFTLSDITVSSFGVKKDHVKIQSSKETQETDEPELPMMKVQPIKTFSIVSEVQFSYQPKIKPIKNKRIFSQIVSILQIPNKKHVKDFSTQVQIINQQERLKKEIKLQQQFTEDQSLPQMQSKQKIYPQKKSKKEKKHEKIAEKKKTYKPKKRQQKLEQNDSKKSTKKERNQQKIPDQKLSSKQEIITDFPFQGVLRNCQCCGKLISKLCFKCPHLYCKAQNCPRKRKKLLNQKMLQKMKEQKIKQHYRQRQLYEKMKRQQGGVLNAKISESSKRQRNEQCNQEKAKRININRSKARKHNKNQFQISSKEWKTSQQQLDSQLYYDSQTDDQKLKPQKKKQVKLNKIVQKNDENIEYQPFIIQKEERKNEKEIHKKSAKKQENKNIEHKKYNQIEKLDSFSLSLLIQNDQSNKEKSVKLKTKKQSESIFNQKIFQQNKQSFKFFNDYNKKDQNYDFYFDQDFQSTF